MRHYERLSNVLERQRSYRVLDSVVALVFVIGLAFAALVVAMQLPSVGADSHAGADITSVDSTTYTARLLADGDTLQ